MTHGAVENNKLAHHTPGVEALELELTTVEATHDTQRTGTDVLDVAAAPGDRDEIELDRGPDEVGAACCKGVRDDLVYRRQDDGAHPGLCRATR